MSTHLRLGRKFRLDLTTHTARNEQAKLDRAAIKAAGYRDDYSFPLTERAKADALAAEITAKTGVAMSVNEAMAL